MMDARKHLGRVARNKDLTRMARSLTLSANRDARSFM
jgi:hypothetical protein